MNRYFRYPLVWLLGMFLVSICSDTNDLKAEKGFFIEGFVSKGIFLFDANSMDSTEIQGRPVANRVHVRYCPQFNDWVFVVADRLGQFSKPMEVLIAGSIVPGEMIGAGSGNYKFMPGPEWIDTEESKKFRFIVLHDIPRLKVVSFDAISAHRPQFVNPDYQPKLDSINPLALR